MSMKTIAAAKFKAQCLALLDRLDADGLIVTKHGKPVATVRPIEHSSARLIGSLKAKIAVKGDLSRTGVKWTAGD